MGSRRQNSRDTLSLTATHRIYILLTQKNGANEYLVSSLTINGKYYNLLNVVKSDLSKGETSKMRTITCIAFCLITLVAIFPIQIYQHDAFAKIDPESIIGIWLLDEGKGDKVEDRSGNGNDGLVVKAKWTDGKLGKGLEFDGTGHVAILASKTTDDYLDGFTYLLWVKPTTAPPNPHTRLIERDWHNPTIQIGAADFYGSIAVNDS